MATVIRGLVSRFLEGQLPPGSLNQALSRASQD